MRWLAGVWLLVACSSGGGAARPPDARPSPDARPPGPCDDGKCTVQRRRLAALRGDLLDRDGVPLATHRPNSSVYVTPAAFDARSRAALILALALEPDEVAGMDAAVTAQAARDRTQAVQILGDQSAVRTQTAGSLAGVEIRSEPFRYYPQGDLAAHAIGYTTALTPDELDRLAPLGYDLDDRVGRYGLERTWENYLRGKVGYERLVLDGRGQRVADAAAATLIQGAPRVEPVAGSSLVLTIDADLQRLAEAAVATHPEAAVVLVEVDTGRILALVSKPSFDRDHLAPEPIVDRALSAGHAPGATYAFVTAIAALEDGLETDASACVTAFAQGGRKLDLYVRRLAEEVGLDRMSEVARAYGFGAPTGLGLDGDAAGRVPTKAWYAQRGDFQMAYTLDAGAGQGDVDVTVLQLAMAYAALADGGTRHVPQLVERVVEPSGATVIAFDPQVAPSAATPPEVLDVIRRAMVDSQTGAADGHAWFAGWAPASDPKVAIAVLVDDDAAPVAREILDGWSTLAK